MPQGPDGTGDEPGAEPPLPDRLSEARLLALVPALRRYAMSLSRSASEAEDLLQDCLERAFARRAMWRGGSLKSWLMTIMTNLDRNRRRSGPHPSAFVDIGEADMVAAAQAPDDPLEADRLRAALGLLPPEQRAVLILVVVEGYAYAEAAAIMDVPIGTVMSRLSRARRKLADLLRGQNIVPLRRI
jgi:RNA polymerase sigma-70 factor, ECF subfamily